MHLLKHDCLQRGPATFRFHTNVEHFIVELENFFFFFFWQEAVLILVPSGLIVCDAATVTTHMWLADILRIR